ncbi:MAG TPA: 16S rRNA (guanine(527)-N(7))-methyltransferase RsmG [Caulobacteraceae bacterium]|jgi:16S rRNA (guanine527-N7)-methyltransferase|nr:16S rRNA (guanine(527)-N(7))-methyltransferase RsmG [Caulobacteraceae bacterium]
MSAAPAPLEPAPKVVDDYAFQAATGANEARMADMRAFFDLLVEWNGRMNLVGPSALGDFWGRHALDSAQLRLIAPEARTWADLGAGAGFPGLVLAILAKGDAGARIHLVESMAKRCRFLQAVVDALSLPVTVHNARAESLTLGVDVVAARACAPMVKLLGYAWPYLRSGATGLFLKGQDVGVELQEAAKSWKFEADLIPSISHTEGRIARLQKVSRVRPV